MFSKIIKDNREKIKNLNLKKRDYVFYDELLDLNKIISFIWARRVWKTYLMFQFILDLINKWFYDLEQVVFIDFSIYKWEIIHPEDIVQSYYSLWNKEKPIFIFDEVQDIENFQKLVLQLYNEWYQIFISGSNSNLLSSELVTEFRWRVYEYFVDPLSFKEILDFNSIKIEKKYSTKVEWEIKSIFNDVLKYGSFPELVISKNDIVRTEILKTYFDILFYKDLIERYKIDNEKAIRFLIKKMILWNTKRLNLIKVFNELKNSGIKIWKNTIYNYFEYLKNIFFLTDIDNFYKKTSNIYFYNFWFSYLFWLTDNLWQNFENFIYLNLKKKYNKIFYKEEIKEIDFYIEDIDLNIQVCYELTENNIEREISALLQQKWKHILVYFNKTWEFKYDWIEIMSFIDFFEIDM